MCSAGDIAHKQPQWVDCARMDQSWCRLRSPSIPVSEEAALEVRGQVHLSPGQQTFTLMVLEAVGARATVCLASLLDMPRAIFSYLHCGVLMSASPTLYFPLSNLSSPFTPSPSPSLPSSSLPSPPHLSSSLFSSLYFFLVWSLPVAIGIASMATLPCSANTLPLGCTHSLCTRTPVLLCQVPPF